LVDGAAYFSSLARAIDAIDLNAPDHFFHCAAWGLQPNFELLPDPYSTTTRTLSQLLAQKISRVRALLWENPLAQIPMFGDLSNDPALTFFNGFPPKTATTTPCRAIRDDRQGAGSGSANHMKIVTVRSGSPSRLLGYCGGIDVVSDRVTDGRHEESLKDWGLLPPTPLGLHDTMLEIEGPAAYQLDRVLHKRWVDADLHGIPSETPNKAPFDLILDGESVAKGDAIVQIAMTIDSRPTPPYGFATSGDTTLRETLFQSIRRAREFIYIEDQYFRDRALIAELESAASRGVLIIAMVPTVVWDPSLMPTDFTVGYLPLIGEVVENWTIEAPKALTAQARNRYPELFNVYGLFVPDATIYVHSKLAIIDDILLSCGSANMDTRGLGGVTGALTSCECNAFAVDSLVTRGGRRALALDARIRLWSEHLFEEVLSPTRAITTSLFYEPLLDPIAAHARFWASDSVTSRVRRLT
jgi:phosphatidylserine/phosphatidylglycerophosphate/cardiolipin synthase-like enzyme